MRVSTFAPHDPSAAVFSEKGCPEFTCTHLADSGFFFCVQHLTPGNGSPHVGHSLFRESDESIRPSPK